MTPTYSGPCMCARDVCLNQTGAPHPTWKCRKETAPAPPAVKESLTTAAHTAVPEGYALVPIAWFEREIPRIDAGGPNPIDPVIHCCEFVLHLERERIHAAIDAMLATAQKEEGL